MTPTLAIASKEFTSLFRTGAGWILCVAFLLLAGLVFAFAALRPGEPATMRDFFTLSNWLLMFLCPALSMRLFAEEQRAGTLELVLTAPVREAEVVAGKLLGAGGALCAMLALSLVYPATLLALSPAPIGPILAGYAGLALVGLLYLSLGALCSALASSQAGAFVSALFSMQLIRVIATQGPTLTGRRVGDALGLFAVDRRLEDFGRGVIDLAHVAFFLAAATWLATATLLALRSRRRR